MAKGEVGIVRYRRPAMALAYVGDEEASNNSFKDGWFYPGDLGHFGCRANFIALIEWSGATKVKPDHSIKFKPR